jgi:hypothetical protein
MAALSQKCFKLRKTKIFPQSAFFPYLCSGLAVTLYLKFDANIVLTLQSHTTNYSRLHTLSW